LRFNWLFEAPSPALLCVLLDPRYSHLAHGKWNIPEQVLADTRELFADEHLKVVLHDLQVDRPGAELRVGSKFIAAGLVTNVLQVVLSDSEKYALLDEELQRVMVPSVYTYWDNLLKKDVEISAIGKTVRMLISTRTATASSERAVSLLRRSYRPSRSCMSSATMEAEVICNQYFNQPMYSFPLLMGKLDTILAQELAGNAVGEGE
jgi:hypothetical protein